MTLSAAHVADQYETWNETCDASVLTHFRDDFVDHVSGTTGRGVFDLVGGWLEGSLADRRVEHHATTTDGALVSVWYTLHGTHVGNGLPRLQGLPVTGAAVSWPQVHVFRMAEDRVLAHWAVRDDFALVTAIRAAAAS